jgi:hypothetical protein
MVNVVVDFVEVTWAGVGANINSNCVMAEVAWGAMDVKWSVALILDASVYGVFEVEMSGSGDSQGYPMD